MDTNKENLWLNDERLREICNASPSHNRRTSHRIRCCVDIQLKNTTYATHTRAQCVNVSFKGMGIQVRSFAGVCLFQNDILEIWMDLTPELKPIHRRGRLVWLKKIAPLYWRGGIEFISKDEPPPRIRH